MSLIQKIKREPYINEKANKMIKRRKGENINRSRKVFEQFGQEIFLKRTWAQWYEVQIKMILKVVT